MKIELNKFKLPIKLDNDYEYVNHLRGMLDKYIEEINKITNRSDDMIENVKENVQLIIESLKCYYNADIDTAKNKILNLLIKYKNTPFIVSKLDKNYAFRGIAPFEEIHTPNHEKHYEELNTTELSFFKARIGNTTFKKNDMLHIPFDKRELIKTQRFSIPGVPCLYLGTTSYVCWLEMNKPQDSEFNVSSYKIPGELKILNLVGDQMLINGLGAYLSNDGSEKENFKLVETMIEIFPLIYATSYSINNSNRQFKSEYIISQLIMQCLQELEIDGVAYVSKKLERSIIGYMQCINLAIPIKYVGDYIYENSINKYGQIFKNIKLTNPINLAEYQKLVHFDIHVDKYSFINSCFSNGYTSQIRLAGKDIVYQECTFSKFDNYLCSQVHEISEIFNDN
ncbi:hypothetical protein NNC19_22555 [Clostridium sp. SHJSY1]|uniref:hypothetical protein n=1 Tax=Clostridium sp. SHJSY1 TaxID=2942483 RepID=UPI002874B41D|nr:hypothetical protein [Clostridium sp. SHJSY1]MDS0528475.1 hypothetical protein [Clostridium sp. SHJSY1]